MNIKTELEKVLQRTGWTPSRLAQEVGITPSMVSKILLGQRQGMHMRTFLKLQPYFLGDLPRQDQATPEA
jgi:predicted transcriptional regulator